MLPDRVILEIGTQNAPGAGIRSMGLGRQVGILSMSMVMLLAGALPDPCAFSGRSSPNGSAPHKPTCHTVDGISHRVAIISHAPVLSRYRMARRPAPQVQ